MAVSPTNGPQLRLGGFWVKRQAIHNVCGCSNRSPCKSSLLAAVNIISTESHRLPFGLSVAIKVSLTLYESGHVGSHGTDCRKTALTAFGLRTRLLGSAVIFETVPASHQPGLPNPDYRPFDGRTQNNILRSVFLHQAKFVPARHRRSVPDCNKFH